MGRESPPHNVRLQDLTPFLCFKLLVALNRLLWYQYPRQRRMALPRSTDSEETIVESTINLGGYHGNWHCLGRLDQRVRGAGGSDFVVSI